MLSAATAAMCAFNGGAMLPATRAVSSPVTDVTMMATKGKKAAPKSTALDPFGNPYVEAQLDPIGRWNFDEIGVLPPLGRWDPLNIRAQGPERYRRFVEMEIKHGRLAMAAVTGILVTYSGMRFPGYLSQSLDLKFEDVPGTMIGSWATVPAAGWVQIVLWIAFCEIDFLKQDPSKDPGDVVKEGTLWARYDDGYTVWLGDGSTKTVAEDELFLGKTWKLNAERNNGRAAMMGIAGMFAHELLTGNPVFPLGEA